MKKELKIIKDGSKIRIIVNEVDENYPAAMVVGHVYVFNSRIITDKSFSISEFTNLIGCSFNKHEVSWKL